MTAAILSALANAGMILHLKWFLRYSKVESRNFLPALFLWLFLLTSFLVPAFGGADLTFFRFRNLLLFGVLIAVAVMWNILFLDSFRQETVHEYELNEILFPIFSITLAALTFVDERDPIRLALAALAVGAFLVSHLSHRHLRFKHTDRWMVYAVFLMGVEVILAKPLLTIISPVSLYAIRTGIIGLIFFLTLRPELRRLHLDDWMNVMFNAALGVATKVFELTAIRQVGVVVTQLVLLLAPVILAIASLALLRERWSARQGLAFVVIVACIVVVTLLPT